MAKILDMPKLSPTMEEGVLSAWHKKEGDEIKVDDLLAEVETDKATMEFRAFDNGTLLKLLVTAGSNVKLGQPVAILGKKGEDISSLDTGASSSGPSKDGGEAKEEAPAKAEDDGSKKEDAKDPAEGEEAPSEKSDTKKSEKKSEEGPPAADDAKKSDKEAPTKKAPEKSIPLPTNIHTGSILDRTEREAEVAKSDARVLASPYLRQLARDRGIDLSRAVGSGPNGRLVAADLDNAAPTQLAKAGPSDASKGGALATTSNGLLAPIAKPNSMMRKTIAKRLVESKQKVPHFYLTIELDADRLAAFREEINEELRQAAGKQAEDAIKVSVNDLLIKACAVALRRVPECNAQYTDEAILLHQRVDVSVAVAVPDGLVTPVIRNADQKSVVAISKEIRELAGRARAKKLKPEEMQNGTFSISNLGMFGIDEFSAVINPPEGAILAVGRVREVPVVREGQVVVGKTLSMTLSCDHRVVDGAVGAAFLAELRALLERPMRVLLG